jgi:formyltetrahydrofolate deformylase
MSSEHHPLPNPHFVLTASCPFKKGIDASVVHLLTAHGCDVHENAQFRDRENGQFFLRVAFTPEDEGKLEEFRKVFSPLADQDGMTWKLHAPHARTRTLIMVSMLGHCLVDLLYRHRIGALAIDIPLIVSNHEDFADVAAAHRIPFRYLPVGHENKPEQEKLVMELIKAENIELVVLARYMEILSSDFAASMPGRIINVHHALLPSFKGARPNHQAHERGVKLIGATSHYVTSDLDDGQIIEQAVERVGHGHSPGEIAAIGRDVENVVLARAVKWHAEHRIFISGPRTVVFV